VPALQRLPNRLARPLLVLLGCACLLAVPAAASAQTFQVNSRADSADDLPGDGTCASPSPNCTLRAAIEESNATIGPDRIVFSPLFSGLALPIQLSEPLPAITGPTSVEGGECTTATGLPGPCVELRGDGLVISADDSSVSGLAIGTSGIGIAVAAEGFTATGNWLGVGLDGTAHPGSIGIALVPFADGARIGGTEASDRNVVVNQEGAAALSIVGASSTEVLGNYFGVGPDGVTAAANQVDITVADHKSEPAAFAAYTTIGTTPQGAAAASAECDGGCNVISGAVTGVQVGDIGSAVAPAHGPTTVVGNYVGLDATGTVSVPNSQYGILNVGSFETTVGGPTAAAGNLIAGGENSGRAIESGNAARRLTVTNNRIGLGSDGTRIGPPNVGVNVDSRGLTSPADEAVIGDNTIAMGSGGDGVRLLGPGGFVFRNRISRGGVGVELIGDTSAFASQVTENVVLESSSVGIVAGNDDNRIVGNQITDSRYGVAVSVEDAGQGETVEGNVVGGESATEENVISGATNAIVVVSPGSTHNEIGRNCGGGNKGKFIYLYELPGEGKPNEGIDPPVVADASPTAISGTALPGAKVRVFRKDTDEEGEIAGFVGVAIADGTGAWTVTPSASLAGGTRLAATQTNTNGATSELASGSVPVPPQPPVDPGPADGGKAVDGGKADDGRKAEPAPPAPAPGAPTIRRLRFDPPKPGADTVTFRFASAQPGAVFQCRLDKAKFSRCGSPKTYRHLKPGKHVFRVRAVGASGLAGVAVKRDFSVAAGFTEGR
jgi:CSLREA domain-containing protein